MNISFIIIIFFSYALQDKRTGMIISVKGFNDKIPVCDFFSLAFHIKLVF